MPNQGNRPGASTPESLSTKLNRIAETARQHPSYQFRTLAHLISEEMLAWAFQELRKDAAAGVDGVTAQDYRPKLKENLSDLHHRMKQGQYRAQPLRRIYIDKEDGKQRALSIPALEDKIAQKAVTEILTRIYEQDFLDCSYGYRPKKSAQDALDALRDQIIRGKVKYVLEADIQDYFGSIVRGELMKMLNKRIGDKNLLRLIGKWLHVGVIEDGKLLMSEEGTYQGSVISPILANVYLHEVLDQWVEHTVKPRMRGEMSLFRYADDFVACFQFPEDAARFQEVLAKRFEKYGLTLHPKKTRLIEFGRFAGEKADEKTGIKSKPKTFSFLGFTLIGVKTRQGKFTVKAKTMSKRLSRGLKRVSEWCRENRHKTLKTQHAHLSAILRGHYQYYGRRLNHRCLHQFYYAVHRIWRKWLSRRNRDGLMGWKRFAEIQRKYPLPPPRITQGAGGYQSKLSPKWC